jgi:hypothetical protein
MPKGCAPVALLALIQHSSVAEHWQSDDMLTPHISHLILADCTAPGDLKLQKLPRGLRDFPPFSPGNQGRESILQRLHCSIDMTFQLCSPPDAPPATHDSLRLRCSRRSHLQPCDPVFIGSGSAGGRVIQAGAPMLRRYAATSALFKSMAHLSAVLPQLQGAKADSEW